MKINLTPSSSNKATTSYQVAFQLDKENKNVVNDIERLSITEEFRKRNFIQSEYEIILPENIRRYESFYKISRNGYFRLIMDYSDSISNDLKEKFIKQFTMNEINLISKKQTKGKFKKK
jgi:Rha family phage regulatory protein